MKVTIIIPPKVRGKWIVREDKHVAPGNKQIVPRTAQQLAALIGRELPEVELSLVEAQRDDLSMEEVRARVEALAPDMIVTYLSCFHIPEDRECAELSYPTIGIILHQGIDRFEAQQIYGLKTRYLCKREIEMPVVAAIREFMRRGDVVETPGFLRVTQDGIEDTGDAAATDLDDLPVQYHPLFDPERYFSLRESNRLIKSPRSINLNTMRGCLFRCLFCGQANKKGVRPSFQSPARVLETMRFYHDTFGVTHFAFADNEFAADMARAKDILHRIIDSGLKVEFVINNRVELFDDEFIRLLAQAGCVNVRLGIETCDPAVQGIINKRLDLNKAKALVLRLREQGLTVHFYMTPGFPGETPETLEMNARFVAEADPDTISSGPLFLMPGSLLYEQLKQEGRILDQDWSHYRDYQTLPFKHDSYGSIEDVLAAEKTMLRLTEQYGWKPRA